MKLVEILNPLLLAVPIEKFIRKFGEPQKVAVVVAMMKQYIVTAPTYLRAVKDQKGRYVAYLWATVLGGTAFVQQVYSSNRQARKILFDDLDKWCRARGIDTISGLTKLDNDTPAFRRWSAARGFTPVQVLYTKHIGGK